MIGLLTLQRETILSISVSSFPYTTQVEAYTVHFGLNDGDGFDWNNTNVTFSGSQSNMNIGAFGSNTNFYNITFLNSGSFTLKGASVVQFGAITPISASDLTVANCSFLMGISMQDNVQYAGFVSSAYGAVNVTGCVVNGSLKGMNNISAIVNTVEYSSVVTIQHTFIDGNVSTTNYSAGFVVTNFGKLNITNCNHTGFIFNITSASASFVGVMQGASLSVIMSCSSEVYFVPKNVNNSQMKIGPVSGYARGGAVVECQSLSISGNVQAGGSGSSTAGRLFGWADSNIQYKMTNVVSSISFECPGNNCCFSSTSCQSGGGNKGNNYGYTCQ